MRILISSILLIGGLNLILARSLYWNDHDSMANMWLNNYDDELFQYPSNRYNDDIHKMVMGESAEESNETPFNTAIDNEEDVKLANFFSSMFDPFHEIDSTNKEKSEEDTNNNEEISNNDNDDEDEDDKDDDEENNQFEIFLHVPSDNMETDLEVSKSSEEKKDDEEENSDEVSTPSSNVAVELIDLTKSSEEKEDVDEQVDLSKKDIEELAAFIISLTAIDDLMKIAHENPDYADNEQDEELKCKEVDGYLNLFSSLLDKILEDERNTTENEENNDDATMATNDSDKEDIDYTTPKTDSNEDDDTDDDDTTPKTDSNEDDETDDDYTTPKNDSNEDDDTNDDYTTPKNDSNEDDDINTSNSKENEIEDISFVLHSIDDDHHDYNLNDHKYEIVETSANDSPYMNVIRSSSSSRLDNQNVIEEYVGIRQDLDIEQDSLQMNKLNLDKDFYNIISDDFNEDSIKKFEKDFFVVHENLDRFKRNVNAMQNLNSKLYLHKLIKDAVKDVQHK